MNEKRGETLAAALNDKRAGRRRCVAPLTVVHLLLLRGQEGRPHTPRRHYRMQVAAQGCVGKGGSEGVRWTCERGHEGGARSLGAAIRGSRHMQK